MKPYLAGESIDCNAIEPHTAFQLAGFIADAELQGLAERRQLHQIILRDRFNWLAGFAPGSKASDNHERVEAFFPKQVRHPGASRFARSSTVEINVFVFGKIFDLLFEVVWLDADGILDAGSAGVVVTMAANIDDQNLVRSLRR